MQEEHPRKQAIVIVEDNQAIAELIKDTLNAETDYQAVAVHDGALALDTIRAVKASLIILDISLPGLDGLQIYDLLKQDEATSGTPILFITALAHDPGLRERQITSVLAKPFDLDDLLSRVAEICRQ